ncbi:MAG: PAS domain S-box protein [Verrucomicrobiota bacterium]
MKFEDLPIRSKIMAAILLTSITVGVLTAIAFIASDLLTIRQDTIREFSSLARVVAETSAPAVTSNDVPRAHTLLASLRSERQVLAAALYGRSGKLLATYPTNAASNGFPARPAPADGYQVDHSQMLFFEPVIQNNVRSGTLFLRVDRRLFYDGLQRYALLSAVILLASMIIVCLLSNRLQRNVSEPILALIGTTRRVSEWGDYSVRASKINNDELGLLTEAFNQMLSRIQDQTVALQENESRLRLALEAANTGTWDWNVKTGQITWDDRTASLFGQKPGAFGGTYTNFMEFVHPADRKMLESLLTQAIAEKKEFTSEFRILWSETSVRTMFSKGRAFYDEQGKATRMTGVIQDITERKQSDDARRQFAAIVESTDDSIVGKELNGIVTSWNKSAERIFGYTAAEILGQGIERIAPPENAGFEERVLAAVKRGETRLYETQRVRKDGKRIDVSLTVSPIRNAEGTVVGASSISRDITERKLAEQALRESRARLSGIIDSAMDAIISVDSDQRITVFNNAAEAMFRCSTSEALGQPLQRFIPERFRKKHDSSFKEFEKSGTTNRAPNHLRPLAGLRANGEEFPIEASISHIEVAGQQIYTVILRDITERMEAQQALERQAGILREQAQMLDLANVMARDLSDRVILWNTGMEKMYGWLRSETIGQVSHAVLQTRFPIPLEEIQSKLNQHGSWEGEIIHTHKNGQQIIVNSHWVQHKNPNGKPIAILEINTDITERKRAEQEILRINAELEQRVRERTAELMVANQELEAFTYSVAHDLRAPLRHIDAFTKIIFDDFASAIPPEVQRYLENIRKGSQNMNQLVDDLLNLARIGRQELKREITPLSSVVQQVISELKRETANRKIEWHIRPLPAIETDPGLIKQVFVNLCSNAVKYTRPRPAAVIEVGQLPSAGPEIFYIRDNGVGFNMKYVDKLFGVFQRLHRADEFEGTGVGLVTVERIIRKHGGQIWAEAELDRGATFYFTLRGHPLRSLPTRLPLKD